MTSIHFPSSSVSVQPVIDVATQAKKAHPDFFKFIIENHLESRFAFFNHSVTYTRDGEPQILLEGQPTRWSDAKMTIFKTASPPSLQLPFDWKYNGQGIVEKKMITWKQLEPDWKDRADPRPGHFFVELVSKQSGCMGVSRHCWLRLIDDQSNVISVGFGGKVLKWLPFRAQKGKLMSPDPGEFESGHTHCTRMLIPKRMYNKLKARIENDQKTRNVYFNMITRNCSVYACEILKEIVNIDNREYPTQALGRLICNKLNIKPPRFVCVIFDYIAQFFRILLSPIYCIGILILGGAYKDRGVADVEKHSHLWDQQPEKPFSRVWSFFNGSNFRFGTGWKVTKWQREVAQWRAQQIQEIEYEKAHTLRLTPEKTKEFERRIFLAKYRVPPHLEASPLGFDAPLDPTVENWLPS